MGDEYVHRESKPATHDLGFKPVADQFKNCGGSLTYAQRPAGSVQPAAVALCKEMWGCHKRIYTLW